MSKKKLPADIYNKRFCTSCETYKDIETEFTSDQKRGDKLYPRRFCKACVSAKAKVYYKEVLKPLRPASERPDRLSLTEKLQLTEKRCGKCHTIQPISQFFWNKQHQTFSSYCKTCKVQYNKEHYAEEYFEEYEKKNKAKLILYRQEYYEKNKEKIKKKNMERYYKRKREGK